VIRGARYTTAPCVPRSRPSHSAMADTKRTRAFKWLVAAAVIAVAIVGGWLVLQRRGPTEADREWRHHGGDPGHRQFSPLAQINRVNVSRLQVAWTYRSGDADPQGRSQIQCNPIVVRGVLYATSPQLKAVALNAATGKPIWTFDPFSTGAESHRLGVNRGLTYWEDGDDRRIFLAAGQRLYALNAETGRPIDTFGERGNVSLTEGLGRDVSRLYVLSNTPGAIYKDVLIIGTRVSEGPGPSAPGHIRAFDVRTGRIRWVFRTIPHPGEYGYDTWPPEAWTYVGGANAWSGISVDHERGLVFLPTGSAAFDFWGGNRHGANLFANTVLVLNAATGQRVWHYQLVHHDVWDRDPPTAPILLTVTRDGKPQPAVAQLTKSAHVFLFHRETGKPLFPIEERPVPPSDLEGEQLWPTQPLPLAPPPFSRQILREEDLTDISPESHAAVLKRFREIRSAGQFTPMSTEGTVVFPGLDGGAEWGGASFDENTGLLFVNGNEMPWLIQMVPVPPRKGPPSGARLFQMHCGVCHGPDRKGEPRQMVPSLVDVEKRLPRAEIARILEEGKGVMPSFAALSVTERDALVDFLFGKTAVAHGESNDSEPDENIRYTITGYNRFLDPDGYPAVKPPWGTLNAIDLNAGKIAWTVRLGELPELTARGIPPTGTENYGGPVATAGGVIFIAATKDEKFRAFDQTNGALLWETQLPAGGYATPATYEVDGRQYVVIAAGGGKMGTKSGDAYIAFALPD
jgi:quinoprotein glucose dehydrogenase